MEAGDISQPCSFRWARVISRPSFSAPSKSVKASSRSICTGTSNTHVKTLCDYAEYTLEQLGEPMLGREGHRGNSWELLDYGSIVVHVFTEEARKFYDLERLWADAELVDIRDIIIEEN